MQGTCIAHEPLHGSFVAETEYLSQPGLVRSEISVTKRADAPYWVVGPADPLTGEPAPGAYHLARALGGSFHCGAGEAP